MTRLKLTLQYDGSPYHGWQRVSQAASVQAEVERALAQLHQGQLLEMAVAGRTDKGVHARGQVVHVDLPEGVTPHPLIRYLDGLNHHLRPHIAVTGVATVTEDFHARFSACARRYSYTLYNRRQLDPLIRDTAAIHRTSLNWERIQDAIAYIPLGEGDWSSFRSAECQAKHPRVYMDYVRLTQTAPYTWRFDIQANRFLHHMVRTIVGTLIEIGQETRPADDFIRILQAKDRTQAGSNAPAAGLVLEEVIYPENILQETTLDALNH